MSKFTKSAIANFLRGMAEDIERQNIFVHEFVLTGLKFEERTLSIEYVEYDREELDNE